LPGLGIGHSKYEAQWCPSLNPMLIEFAVMKGEDRFNKVPFWQVWRYLCLLDSLVNVITKWGNKVLDSHKFDITLPKMFVIIFTRHSKRREQRNRQV